MTPSDTLTNLISLDIETKCGVTTCEGGCEHALDPYRNTISCIGVYSSNDPALSTGIVFRDLSEFKSWIFNKSAYTLVGHNLKFDLHVLASKGIDLTGFSYHDTNLMAAVCTDKIPETWLNNYEVQRKEENKKLPRGFTHRKAKGSSLKTLAPYFLGVSPFWEDPSNHDNDRYVIQDCRYTFDLFKLLEAKLKSQGSWDFYKEKLLPWSSLTLKMEMSGISLDVPTLLKEEEETKRKLVAVKNKLDAEWDTAYGAFYSKQVNEIELKYTDMMSKAVSKIKKPDERKISKTISRYHDLAQQSISAIEFGLNLDSPKQLQWLFKDHFKLDITDFHGDESTGITVLQKLATTREDIALYLEYRKLEKLATAFFPSYKEKQINGIIHCNYNMSGTRTGRLSSSNPNLQQVAKGLHKLFVARKGHKLATYDMSAIEPRLIAYYSEDPILVNLLATGADFHGYNTKILFGLDCEVEDIKKHYERERKVGKEIGLALMYGAGPRRIQESAQKYGFFWELNECRNRFNNFKEAFKDVFRFKNELDRALEAGETIKNILGRPYKLKKEDVYMKGINTLIQSSASDLVLNSAERIQKEMETRGYSGGVRLLVHDEIVTEIPEDKEEECVAIIKKAMVDYVLTTSSGRVSLEVEGKVSKEWTK